MNLRVDRAAQEEALRALHVFCLPWGNRVWRGNQGNWTGAGSGSSVDFQEHRSYLPGDDPRHINWMAYARSGNYTLKLFRQEVAPELDLAVDLSASMAVTAEKWRRACALAAWCVGSAREAGASIRIYAGEGGRYRAWQPAGEELRTVNGTAALPDLAQIPWRRQAMRVWISDLLFQSDAASLFRPLGMPGGRSLIFAPYDREEEHPSWEGNLEFIDCENGRHRPQRITSSLMERYQKAYGHHMAMCREAARKLGTVLARIPSEDSLSDGLRKGAVSVGAAEWTS